MEIGTVIKHKDSKETKIITNIHFDFFEVDSSYRIHKDLVNEKYEELQGKELFLKYGWQNYSERTVKFEGDFAFFIYDIHTCELDIHDNEKDEYITIVVNSLHAIKIVKSIEVLFYENI